MSEPAVELTPEQRIEAMKEWATSQLGKLTGPITDRPGETILDPDKFINAQLLLMEHNKPKSLMFTCAYMRLYTLKCYLTPPVINK